MAALALLPLLLLPTLVAALDVPPLRNRRVNDDANIIPAETRQRIEQKLAEFEQRTTNQIAVLTVESLEGDPIEDFSLRVAEAWKLGQAGKDNGVLLVVSEADRRMRIDVGYGLEPVLTDLETNVIQRERMVPAFRQGDYGGGIEAGVDAIMAAIQGEEIEPVAGPEPLRGRGGQGQGLPGFLLFALIFLVPFSLSAARSGSWLVGLFLTPFYFFLGSMVAPLLGIIAAGVWIVVFSVLRLLLPRRRGSRYRRGGGWWIGPGFGGGGGGWSGGGGFGGGGFSGGGGSFGGGGSSSSW
ncbi:MAG TPA: TPM domain-containing protein [Thermoanaerobaculia bacterium]|nr:TPM domain-containing protein [Thermoanaerobaculia bacterium]